jgi:hypothetical protein
MTVGLTVAPEADTILRRGEGHRAPEAGSGGAAAAHVLRPPSSMARAKG